MFCMKYKNICKIKNNTYKFQIYFYFWKEYVSNMKLFIFNL